MITLMNVLLPDESQLCIDRIEMEEEVIVLSVSSTNPTQVCVPYAERHQVVTMPARFGVNFGNWFRWFAWIGGTLGS